MTEHDDDPRDPDDAELDADDGDDGDAELPHANGTAPVMAADEPPPLADAADADAAAAALDGAPAEGADGEPQGPPFVLEEWALAAIEALAFSSTEPLSPAKAREVIAGEMATMDGMEGKGPPTTSDMKAAFRTLLERWSSPERPVAQGFRLVEIDGGLCFRTAAANARYIRRAQMGKPQRLSRASLETLAVVAYRQPVTKPQIEEVRGVDCSGALKALLDKKLIRVLGKAEEIGRPLLYGTTKTFLEFFEMQSLTDLPTLKELHELEHGVTDAPPDPDERPAVVMDLFNAEQVNAVSAETEAESNEALEALERALGDAKDVAKRASALVFGMKVEDEDAKPGAEGAPAPAPEAPAAAAPAEGEQPAEPEQAAEPEPKA